MIGFGIQKYAPRGLNRGLGVSPLHSGRQDSVAVQVRELDLDAKPSGLSLLALALHTWRT